MTRRRWLPPSSLLALLLLTECQAPDVTAPPRDSVLVCEPSEPAESNGTVRCF